MSLGYILLAVIVIIGAYLVYAYNALVKNKKLPDPFFVIATQNPNLVPALLLLGAAVVPISFVTLIHGLQAGPEDLCEIRGLIEAQAKDGNERPLPDFRHGCAG